MTKSKRCGANLKVNPSEILHLVRDFKLHSADLADDLSAVYAALDTPVSLSCALLFKYKEFDQLVEKEILPSHYNDPIAFRNDFAAVSLLRKSQFLKTSFDRKETALTAFRNSENACKDVNRNLRGKLSSGQINPDDWYVINSHIRKIERFLGSFNIDEMLDECGWGPGSSLQIKGEDTSAPRKFNDECDITPAAYDLFLPVMLKAYPLWEGLKNVRLKTSSLISTVPKNAKTDRTIAIEPGINVWIQKGIGRIVRRKLRRVGFNLDSDLKNQRQAYLGSVNDSVATIDFKAASDSISSSLVEFLLPPRWFTILNSARTHFFTLGGSTICAEKFSTMGNGFTFELESLIFVTLALAICEAQGVDDSCVSIFGDDLVIPPSCVPQLNRLCELYGLTINQTKSYEHGPFRESCGSYYFNGLDVKPFFLKKDVKSLKPLFSLINGIRLLAHRFGHLTTCDKAFQPVWLSMVNRIPKPLRFFGPISAGDSVISDNIGSTASKAKDGWEGFSFPGLPTKAVESFYDNHGLNLARLYQTGRATGADIAFGNSVSLRSVTKIVFKKAMFAKSWYDLGPWVLWT